MSLAIAIIITGRINMIQILTPSIMNRVIMMLAKRLAPIKIVS